ncbi:hypothetical protein NIES4071_16360 [Calothrix sp. NIES-4071]|nr:hypothetical protein NIES4071_16360 [Calothrix sp. NIES-4071]BAZ55970.1 hypothetical protein NIES4105_16310 [Calothrix sp. NIES-4105]
MNLQTDKDKPQALDSTNVASETQNEKILCPHCLRTATNGIKCKGICVADSDY